MKVGLIITLFSVFTGVFTASMFIINNTVKNEIHALGDSLRTDINKKVESYQNVYTVDEIMELVREQQTKEIQDLTKLIKTENRKQLRTFKNYIETERNRYDTLYYKTPLGRYYRVIHDLRADSIHRIETIEKKDIK